MAVRKIDLMHQLYGTKPDQRCKDCKHFWSGLIHDYRYNKCQIYGFTNSEASDWRLKYQACGLFNKDTYVRNVINFVKPEHVKLIMNEPIDGQIDIFKGVETNG